MAIYCDLCTELYTSKTEVENVNYDPFGVFEES